MKTLLKEISKIKKIENEFDEKLDEISKIFETLQKGDFNSAILRKLQITCAIGKQKRLYSEESLHDFCNEAQQLSNLETPFDKLGKKLYEVAQEIKDGKYDNLMLSEFSNDPKYYAIKKLFLNFRNNYSINSKLF